MRISRAPISAFVLLFLSAVFPPRLSLGDPITCSGIVPMKHRSKMLSISDFGAVGDGATLNTNAFNAAIDRIRNANTSDGTLLYVPRGVYLTESFNLTSHMTLYLAEGAVIKAVQVMVYCTQNHSFALKLTY
ncbi:unnamed protein product [Thlaspi arvense]|uniref:Rhamnogalacturonase A/B/Epimerase-like pectate lyase domain-containing protein n=1 Tax=Thlaspi arvense TaxID=13288 RepID=A0AAU9TDX5_THLAR|nr:unnamed protein product [Thlaspi arvense]